MRGYSIALAVAMLLPAAAPSQPYGWFTGSTARAESKTGDRVVIVDLSDGSTVTPTDGWDFADFSPGSDPNVPGFSPDGRFVYLINGGDGNVDQPSGYIYVFDTSEVLGAFAQRSVPGDPIQIVELPSVDEDAIEPVGLTVAPQGDRVYLTEAKEENLHVWNVNADGSLSAVNKIPTGGSPTPFWLSSNGDRGWFVVQPTVENPTAQLKEVGLRITPPAITKTINLPLPAPTDEQALPLAFCGFPMAPGASVTTVPPSDQAPADDTYLYISAGWNGFRVESFLGTSYINGPVNVYRYDTVMGALSPKGAPVQTVTPGETQVTFPTLVQSYETENAGNYTHTAGSAMVHNSAAGMDSVHDTLVMPNADENSLLLGFGMLADFTEKFFISSLSAADGLSFLTSSTYQPVRDDSILFSYGLPGNDLGGDIALDAVVTIPRPLSVVLGFVNVANQVPRVVVIGSDTFFLVRFEGVGTAPTLRDSLCLLVDPASGSMIETDLELVAGAYAEQPLPTTSSPDEVLLALLGTGPATGNDLNADSIVDAADVIAGL